MVVKNNSLDNIIFKTCSTINRNKGKEICKKGLISNIQGKNIEGIYHLYGKIEGEKNTISTHLKIDLKNKRLVGISCSCNNFISLKEEGHSYFCEHIAATGYKFLQAVNKKKAIEDNKEIVHKNKTHKKKIKLQVKVEHKNINNVNSLICDFKLNCEKIYPITELKKFLIALINKQNIKVADNFYFDNSKHEIDENDIELLRYMANKIKKDDNLFKGSKLIIKDKDIYIFLKLIVNREIVFKYNYLEYKTRIKEEALPLAFTISDNLENLIITSEKNLPMNMNTKGNALLFNREIYILDREKEDILVPILNKLYKNNVIIERKNEENYYSYISKLYKVTNKVILTEGMKRYSESLSKCNFTIYKDGSKIYCEAELVYGDMKVNLLKDSKFKFETVRNSKFEDKIFITLENNRFIKNDSRLIFVGNDGELFNILNNKANDLKALGNVILGKGFENSIVKNFIKGEIIKENSNIKFKYNFSNLDDGEIKELYESFIGGENFYKNKKGAFIDLEDYDVKSFFELIEVLNLSDSLDRGYGEFDNYKSFLLLNEIDKKGIRFINGKEKLETVIDSVDKVKKAPIKLSSKFKNILRNYQYEGVKWLEQLNRLGLGGILADDMGLGKTLQIIAFLYMQKNKKTLIVAPTSLIFNWKDEFNKFCPSMKIGLVYGEIKRRSNIINEYKKYDALIITYGTLKNHIEEIEKIKFDYCIIDEAQTIKNYKSQVASIVKRVNASSRFALTGTPIENNLSELWSIFDYIIPGYLYSNGDFEKIFNNGNIKSLSKLKLMINPFILRRTKQEVALDLPDKIEKRVFVTMTESQKAMYGSYVKEVKSKLDLSKNSIEMLAYLTRLRQLCLHPAVIMDEYVGDSGKFIEAHKLVKKNLKANGKTLVFSQFTSILQMFGDELEKEKIAFYKLTGDTSPKERIELVNKFNNEEEVNVFLISLKAGGTGLNLTGANLVIHFDPWWNPAVEAQATDRAYRIGQKKQVEVIKLIAKGTIEEKIVLLQEEKQELIGNILNGESISKNNLNKQVIGEIIKNL